MEILSELQFDLKEILALIGVAQCLYVLVYIAFRSGYIYRAALPSAYFVVLAIALMLDASSRHIAKGFEYYDIINWAFWFLGPPFSYLLTIQIAQITRVPSLQHYWVLLLIPAAFFCSLFLSEMDKSCEIAYKCPAFDQYLVLTGLIAGTISMLAIWFRRGFLELVSRQSVMGKQRYWLILSLVIMNILFLFVMLSSLSPHVTPDATQTLRAVLGLGFVYVAGTSLFRIYPQAVRLSIKHEEGEYELTDAETDIALKIERLINLEKLYHEPAFTRKDMATELGVSEAVVSKVINKHFEKSFPQLINEHRVEDAKRLLSQTDAPVKVIASEVGFNSLASFNRVFKDMTGKSPSQFRE